MKNRFFIFNFFEDILFFFDPIAKQTIFFQKNPSPPPPEYQMVRSLYFKYFLEMKGEQHFMTFFILIVVLLEL